MYCYFLNQSTQTEHLNCYDLFFFSILNPVTWIWQIARLGFSAFYFLSPQVCCLVCTSAHKALSTSTAVHSRPDRQMNTVLLLYRPESYLSRLWYKLTDNTVQDSRCSARTCHCSLISEPSQMGNPLAGAVMKAYPYPTTQPR